ncbi:MAG: hypothetical protein COB24_08855 [Hyphomicrobiales bacterium]|nr:MAG: hypothetical protein COB24_08855 [Hyphomicrobiales bacterium]
MVEVVLNDKIMLQRKAVSTDSMGGQNGEFADLEGAWAQITPIRAKSGLIEGGKKAIGVYKIVTWARAFLPELVQAGDRIIWQSNGDRELYINIQHHKPIGDVYAEYEATLVEG